MLNFPKRLVINGTEWNNNPLKFDVNCIQCSGSTPSWQDIILSGNTALTLVNAKANGLNYVKLFGACEQNGTPSPDTPVDIVSNNGEIKFGKQVTINSTKINGYINTDGIWAYSTDSYTVRIPVTSGNKYKIRITTTDRNVVGSILRWGFTDSETNPTIDTSVELYDVQRTTPQSTTSYESDITATKNYMVLQIANIYAASVLTNGYITLSEQVVYTDGTVETINVHGKNLFDRDTVDQNFVSGKIKNNNGEEINDATSTYSTTYIKVSPSTSYTFSWIGGSAVIQRIYYYTKNKQWISRTKSTFDQSPAIFTTPGNCEYIQVQRQTSVYVAATNIQLELGDTSTEYEPYFNGGTATAEMLLKVGNYQDVQSILDGVVTRNVGVKVFNGTEGFVLTGGGAFRCILNNCPAGTKLMSNYFNGDVNPGKTIAEMPDLSIKGHGTIPKNVYFKYTEKGTVKAFQQYLADQYAAGTPVIVVYPLAEPTTESVAGQALTTQAGTNIVEITQASIDNLALEVSYKGKQ